MTLTPAEEAIRQQANLVAAKEFLMEALSTGPKYCSTLWWGFYYRELTPQAVHRAKELLGVEEYTDCVGNICWRLPEQSPEGEGLIA